MNEIQTSSTMLGNFIYHGTYETYLGELLCNVKPSEREDCEKDVANIYLDCLESALRDELPSSVDDTFATFYEDVHHPKFYNFETDAVLFRFQYEDSLRDWLANYADRNMDVFDRFLHERFTNRDGYFAFVPNNYDDWRNGFNANDNRCVSVLLWYFLFNECIVTAEVLDFYDKVTEMIREVYTPYEYAVKFKNGYVGYCVCSYDDDRNCDKFDAYLFDNDGNVTNVYIFDESWVYNGSAYSAWDNELECEVTNGYENVGYASEEMDIREFYKLFDGKF